MAYISSIFTYTGASQRIIESAYTARRSAPCACRCPCCCVLCQGVWRDISGPLARSSQSPLCSPLYERGEGGGRGGLVHAYRHDTSCYCMSRPWCFSNIFYPVDGYNP